MMKSFAWCLHYYHNSPLDRLAIHPRLRTSLSGWNCLLSHTHIDITFTSFTTSTGALGGIGKGFAISLPPHMHEPFL